MTEKRCSKCREVKGVGEFTKNKSRKGGLAKYCRGCVAERSRRYHEANQVKVAESNRRYREANQVKVAESNRRYREANQVKVAESRRRCYEVNREIVAERGRRYCEALGDGYVAHRLGLPTAQAPPDLIELKRQQLKLYRTIKNAKENRHGTTGTENSASK